MNGHYSVITNFGCHWTCPYCIVKKTGSMLYSFSSTNGDHVNIRVCRRCKMDPCRCTMAGEKLLRTIKRKPVPYCSETMLENLRKQDTHQLH